MSPRMLAKLHKGTFFSSAYALVPGGKVGWELLGIYHLHNCPQKAGSPSFNYLLSYLPSALEF